VEPNDDALVRAALAGDDAAFDRLVLRHYPRCLRFAWRQLGNRADAEEVVQDALVNAYRRLARCTRPERFRSWLFAIVVNHCRSHRRTERRRALLLWHWWTREPPRQAVQPATDGALDLPELLGALPEAQREAFLLKHVEDLTYEEMAEVTGVNVSALKMRVKRATDLLSARVSDERAE
jgi:RNA polymerase sigma-70 factor, ECF subfamily